MSSVNHETVPVRVWADIDVGIAAEVRWLNKLEGVRTFTSCQGTLGEGGPEPYQPYIVAWWPRKHDKAIRERFHVGHRPDSPCGWFSLSPIVGSPPPPESEARVTTREPDREKIARMERWIGDLQKGMYVNCVYCGHRYGREDEVPVSMAEVLKRHVAQCPEHPMSKLVSLLQGASHALRSYQFGNAAPNLAEEMVLAIDTALAGLEAMNPSTVTAPGHALK